MSEKIVRSYVATLRDNAVEIAALRARVAELEDMLFTLGQMAVAPCFACGYTGPGYYQPATHACAERHHRLAGESKD